MWPSFNGALAAEQSVANGGRFFSVVNTVLALCCACISTFAVSSMIHKGKFSMVHIQNATLAGGVAIGCDAMRKVLLLLNHQRWVNQHDVSCERGGCASRRTCCHLEVLLCCSWRICHFRHHP